MSAPAASDATMMHPVRLRLIPACCSSCIQKPQRRGQMPRLSVCRADLFSGVGTLLSTTLAAAVDIKIVQDMLGHSSRAITSDTYTTLLPPVPPPPPQPSPPLTPHPAE